MEQKVVEYLQALKIPVAKATTNDLEKIPYPYLLHLESGGGELISVQNLKDLEKYKEKLQYWSGVILQAQPTDVISDNQNKKILSVEKQNKLFSSLFLTAIMTLVTMSFFRAFSWELLLLMFTSASGLITSYFLFAKELGVTYKAVESFCNAAANTAGCGKVLEAEEGKLFGMLTFSDAAFIYFIAQFIIAGFLVPLTAGNYIIILAVLSLLAMPVVFYSLYLQSVKIKTWCRLCLVVSGVLSLQAVLFLYFYINGMLQPLQNQLFAIVVFGFILTIAGTSVFLIKNILQRMKEAELSEVKANKIKNSPEVFLSLLLKERRVITTPLRNDFIIGKKEAPVKLIIAVNLFCTPCKSEIEHALELLALYPEKVNVTLRFLRSGDDGKSSGYFLRIWNHYCSEDKSNLDIEKSLIQDWYEVMDLDEFKNKHPLKSSGKFFEDSIEEEQYDWIKKSVITKTPTTFISGFELPKQYKVDDLKPLIPGLLNFDVEEHTENLIV